MSWLIGRRLPRALGLILHLLGFPAAHALAPWALSLLATRHGWMDGAPGLWNLIGLIPVAAGFYVAFLCIRVHFTAAPQGWRLERTPHYPTPEYLLVEGPYKYSRNPIYLAELVIWLGWMMFYGNVTVVGVFVALALVVGPLVMRREERGLEARFGDAYRAYRESTPRFLGKTKP
ncbi:MAG: isoprenylcysteine carboxylmethyltransferase family protein [Candidatus Solibacter usitatus]|nr:isoprenylcysteine carboxylmethyltransferase family protein [Candidatus Solibacter usitatus]